MGKLISLVLLRFALGATEPDAATRYWWRHVQALANDGMKGRDSGSPEYRKAAEYVAAQFERAGLKPAGDQGYFQNVPMHRFKVDAEQTSFELVNASGTAKPLQLYRQITLAAGPRVPETVSAGLVFVGPDGDTSGLDMNGKILVQIGRGTRAAAGPTLTIDATGGPDRRRWPVAYAAVVRLREDLPALREEPRLLLCASILPMPSCFFKVPGIATVNCWICVPPANRCRISRSR